MSYGQGNDAYSFVDMAKESGLFKSVFKAARSGATLGPYQTDPTAEGYSCIEQIAANMNAVKEADIIFIQYGFNDIVALTENAVEIGSSKNTADDITICGYVRKICETIYRNNPTVDVKFLNIGHRKEVIEQVAQSMLDIYTELGWSFNKDLFIEHAHKWNDVVISVIRSYGIEIIELLDNGFNEINRQYLQCGDRCHPSTAGHKRISSHILGSMNVNQSATKEVFMANIIATDDTMQNFVSLVTPKEVYAKAQDGCVVIVHIINMGVMCFTNWSNETSFGVIYYTIMNGSFIELKAMANSDKSVIIQITPICPIPTT